MTAYKAGKQQGSINSAGTIFHISQQPTVEANVSTGFPGSSAGEGSACDAGDPRDDSWVGKSPRKTTHSSILGLPGSDREESPATRETWV